MKILFWVPYSTEGPSNRFRVEQYLPYLEEKCIMSAVHPFWENKVYGVLYENGHYLKKLYYFIKGSINRIKDLINLSDYDLLFVHREAYPIGGAFFEKIAASNKQVIYDFDDAIFLSTYSSANRIVSFLKRPRKIAEILKISSVVIAGNNYLRKYAIQYNKNVLVMPTPIDTDKYYPARNNLRNNGKIIIGWMGSYTNNQYLGIIRNALAEVISKYGSSIEIRLVGCRSNFLNIPGIIYQNWSLAAEINDLQSFDIGIMPICYDNWTRGKCAFKIVQYMSVGASVVASPVGMNREIIRDGENGFMAADNEEWVRKLSLLIECPDLRCEFSLKGRDTVEKWYSLAVTAPKFIDIIGKAYAYARK